MFIRLKDAKPRPYSPAVLMGSVLAPTTTIGMLILHTLSQRQPLATEQWIGIGILLGVVGVFLGLATIVALALRRQATGTRL